MANVRLENVYKVYEGGVRAVNDFNLDIPDKEFVVFVGPSGCGKSTTLRMIAGLEDITQGKLYIDDELVNDTESKNRDIAMVFQNYALYPHMTVFQNMAFGLKLRHTPRAEIRERVNKAAEILEISELLTRKPKALSGGQRQRVALGRAIVREPKVFLLDEPLSNLDAKLRVQMRSQITKLHEKLKTTFIYVTHDQTEAMTMGTRIVVMKDGFIQQVDSPVALYNDPANLFVATFLGSPQMNILNAKLDKNGDNLTATLIDADDKPVLEFSSMKTKELVNDSYVGKEVKLGIRPENIEVDPNGNIEGVIDVVEQLGDETIYYCEIPGIKGNVIVKTPFKGRVKTGEKIKLSFKMENAYLFDAETTNSILGVRTYNAFKAKILKNKIQIGKNEVNLPTDLKEKIVPSAFNKPLDLVINVNDISLKEVSNSIKLPINVEFSEDKNDYVAAFFKVDGLNEYFVMKVKLNESINDIKFVYLPVKNMKVFDEEGNLVKSHEIVYSNKTTGRIIRRGDELFVRACGATLQVENKPEYDSLEGQVQVEIDPEKAFVLLNNKLLKQKLKEDPTNEELKKAKDEQKAAKKQINKLNAILQRPSDEDNSEIQQKLTKAEKKFEEASALVEKYSERLVILREELFTRNDPYKYNLITFSAYDEDKSSKKNFIYGLVKGMQYYATFHVDNNFSVYAMDKFKIHIKPEGITLKSIE